MTMGKRRANTETAIEQLKGVLTVLDSKAPPATVLTSIRGMVTDALVILQEPDPLVRRVQFAVLAICQSTSVDVKTVRGKQITRVTIVDQSLYHWALSDLHAMVGGA